MPELRLSDGKTVRERFEEIARRKLRERGCPEEELEARVAELWAEPVSPLVQSAYRTALTIFSDEDDQDQTRHSRVRDSDETTTAR